MKQLLLKDFLLTRRQLVGLCIIILLFSVFHYPTIFFYFIFAFALPDVLFTDENKNKVNRYLLSLPLDRPIIIISRYMYLFLAAFCILVFLWGISAITSLRPDSVLYVVYGSTVYGWQEILICLSIVLIVYAICLPFLFGFSSSIIVHGISIITGILSLVIILAAINGAKTKDNWRLNDEMVKWFRELIPISSTVLFIIGVIMYIISMKISDQWVSQRNKTN